MKTTADAVVIGGGILGASTAHFLAKLGFGDVVLLENRRFAAVSTGHSAAAVRTAYSNPLTIRLARRALEMFRHAEQRLGGDADFVGSGYLMALEPANLESGRRVAELERSEGVRIEELSPQVLRERWPESSPDAVVCGIFEPDSGFVDPVKTTHNLIRSAEPSGLHAYPDIGATGIERDPHGAVRAVNTPRGTIETRVVVNAAGPWGREIGKWVGRNYSFRWSRESDIVLDVPFQTEGYPWWTDPQRRFYCRPAGPKRMLVGLGFPKEIEPVDINDFNPEVDAPTRQRILDAVTSPFPNVKQATVHHGWASLYTITDDWHPLVGPEPDVPGYYACVGGNGHCFKLGPPLGEALAQTIAGRTPDIDITPLRPNRFREGEPFTSVWGGGNRA